MELMVTKIKDAGVRAAVQAAGGFHALGRSLGISHEAIRQWQRVPDRRIIQVEKVTGVDREILRPDLYRRTTK